MNAERIGDRSRLSRETVGRTQPGANCGGRLFGVEGQQPAPPPFHPNRRDAECPSRLWGRQRSRGARHWRRILSSMMGFGFMGCAAEWIDETHHGMIHDSEAKLYSLEEGFKLDRAEMLLLKERVKALEERR